MDTERTFRHLYIKIGLSRCVTTGVALMDGRSRAAGTGGKLRAEMDGSGGGWHVAYEARGYKQSWAGERAGRREADGPNRAKIARSAILARNNNSAKFH